MDMTMNAILKFATTYLAPTMIFFFCLGVIFRGLIYWTVKRQDWFAKQFERRVQTFMEELDHKKSFSFFVVVKRLLEKTFYELFIYRSVMKRRKHDIVMDWGDRVFLIQPGSGFIVKDLLKQLKFLNHGGQHPKMIEIIKSVCQNNPCFNRVFGLIPNSINDVINVLPGIFVIGGIFGTFLGIMDGLHSLTAIDIADVEGTQETMNNFLSHVAFSMSTSIVGIILSVSMTFVNTIFNPEKLFVDIVERFENLFDMLWHRSESNLLPHEIPNFDENKDPAEGLAELAVQNEIKNSKYNTAFEPVKAQHLIDQEIVKLKEGKDKRIDDVSIPEIKKDDDAA